tara:strand:- start:4191 stop:4493 length:303 start_codon:yes stop_codon:yes gene_type:complete
MAYGLKVWTASSYLAFDSENMDAYVKVVTSDAIYMASGTSETVTIVTGFDRVYANGPATSNPASFSVSYGPYDSSVGGYTSFTLYAGASSTFGYVAIRLN